MESTLSYFLFHQLLIVHYSNVPYASDALNAYAHLMQGENELITQYLIRAKVLLEQIHHNSKMCDIPGIGCDRLVQGLHLPHVWWRVATKQDTWNLKEDVFQTIEHITQSEEWNGAFFNPNLETLKPVMQVNKVNYSKAMWQYKLDHSK